MSCLKLSYDFRGGLLAKKPEFSLQNKGKKAIHPKKRIDYYPGGMLMPGRRYNSNQYRFGCKGSEKYVVVRKLTSWIKSIFNYHHLNARPLM
jgi:hypothetical protein